MGAFHEPAAADLWKLFGLTSTLGTGIQQVMYRMDNVIPPSPAELHRAAMAGLLNVEKARVAIEASGCSSPYEWWNLQWRAKGLPGEAPRKWWTDEWDAVWKTHVTLPSAGDLFRLLNLKRVEESYVDECLRIQGFYRDQDRANLAWLSRNQIPGADALVSFALREAWSNQVVQRFAYDAEFPPEFKYWMERQGADGDARIYQDGRPQGDPVTWSQLYWRVHWANISPQQANEMFQRLRPNRIERWGGQLAGLRAFTFEDLNQVLRINDYPQPFRPQLAALAYRKPRLVDIDRFFRTDLIDATEVYEMHLDLGYNPTDARLRTDWLIQQKQSNPPNQVQKRLPRTIVRLYKLGRLTRQQASDRLMRAISNGAYNNAEWTHPILPEPAAHRAASRLATSYLDEADLDREVQNSEALIRAWRKRFLHGAIDAATLRLQMSGAGYQPDFISDFTARLTAELASGRMLLSTDRVRKLAIQGILSVGNALVYLVNLGWRDPELAWLAGQLRRDVQLAAERDAERNARDGQGAERAMSRQVQLLSQQRSRIIRELNRQASPAKLKRYFVRGIISEADLDRELLKRGFDDGYRKLFLSEAREDRAKAIARRNAATVAGNASPEQNGFGGGQFGGTQAAP